MMAETVARLTNGARVIVVMARNDIFPWQTAPNFEAIYVAAPNGPGDVFTVVRDGKQVAINGNAADFIAIYPVEPTP